VWNGAIPHRPAVIVFCQSTTDVEIAQMFLQTSGDVAVLGECRLIESFRFSGPFPMRHDCRQKLKVADMRFSET